jgi:hypothetical protein
MIIDPLLMKPLLSTLSSDDSPLGPLMYAGVLLEAGKLLLSCPKWTEGIMSIPPVWPG